MIDVVATFRVEYTQFLNPQGDATQSLPEFARDPAALLPLYRAMVQTRLFDAKAITLQRTGKLGTFASSLGQEAIGVGVASAIREEDVLLPYYRDHAAQFLRGVTIVELASDWNRDITRTQSRGRDLIEQWLEEMVISLVDKDDKDIGLIGELLGGVEPGKPASQNQDDPFTQILCRVCELHTSLISSMRNPEKERAGRFSIFFYFLFSIFYYPLQSNLRLEPTREKMAYRNGKDFRS
jgi:hypothetical protein